MATKDGSNSYSDFSPGRLKHLRTSASDQERTLEQLNDFLSALIESKFAQQSGVYFIQSGVYFIPTPLRDEGELQNLELYTQDKRYPSSPSTKTLYLSDIASFAQDALNYLNQTFGSQPSVQSLLQTEEFRVFPLDLITTSDELISEQKAFEERETLFKQIQVLSAVVDSLLTQDNVSERGFKSLISVVENQIEKQPLKIWSEVIFRLAEKYREAEDGAVSIKIDKRMGFIEPGIYNAQDFPSVFNQYTEILAKLVKNPENKKKIDQRVFDLLQDFQNSDFYFKDFSYNAIEINLTRKLPSYTLITKAFIEFFGNEVIPYLTDVKKLEIKANEADVSTTQTEDNGGDEPELVEELPDAEVTVTDFIVELRKQIVTELLLQLKIKDTTLRVSSNVLFLRLVLKSFTAELENYIDLQNLIGNIVTLNEEQPADAKILSENSQNVILNQLSRKLFSHLSETIAIATISDYSLTSEYVLNKISLLQTEELFEKVDSDSEQLVSNTVTPNQLSLSIPSAKVWDSLSIADRSTFLQRTDFPITYGTLLQSVSFDLVRDYFSLQAQSSTSAEYFRTLDPSFIISSEYYSTFQAQVNYYLLTQLTADELFALFSSEGRLKKWQSLLRKIESNLVNTPEFRRLQQSLVNAVEKKLQEDSSSLFDNELQRQNLDQNLEILLVVSPNPEKFISTINQAGAEKYFNYLLKSDSKLQDFKNYALTFLATKRILAKNTNLFDSEDIDHNLQSAQKLAKALTPNFFFHSVTSDYETDALDLINTETEEGLKAIQREQVKRVFLEQMWKSLQEQERQNVYESLGVKSTGQIQSIPKKLNARHIFEQFAKRKDKKKSRLSSLLEKFGLKNKIDPVKQFISAADKASETALSVGLNAILPGSGFVLKALNTVARFLGIDTKKAALLIAGGIAGIAALALRTLYAALTTVGGVIGGGVGLVVGFATGGPVGAVLGGVTGSIGGYVLGEAVGVNTMSAAAIAQQAGRTLGTSVVSATQVAPSVLINNLPAVFFTCFGTATYLAVITTHSAFLTPLPTISGEDISPYVQIEKVALEGNKFDTPTDLNYSIRIKAKDGYQIQIVEPPTDEFSMKFTQKEGEVARPDTAVLPPSPTYDAFQASLADFATRNPVITTEPVIVGNYFVPFGTEAGSNDYTDANVTNTFTITFNVLDSNGQQTLELNEPVSAKSAAVICFGDCPQSQGGCWPASGYVTQQPFAADSTEETNSHDNSDAFDIANDEGTPVYAPFKGNVAQASIDAGFGTHLTFDPDGVTSESGEIIQFVFAHLSLINQTGIGEVVQGGSLDENGNNIPIGFMGSTGNSSGPHLHYEVSHNGAYGRANAPTNFTTLVPDATVGVGEFVISCYAE